MLLLLLSPAVAAPILVASSARVTGPPPASFVWPSGASACRADLILGTDGRVERIEPGRCGDALRTVLDGLVGLAFAPPAQSPAPIEVRLVPPTDEQGRSTPVFRTLELGPEQWPQKWPDAMATVPARTTCPVTLTFADGEKPSAFSVEDCPAALQSLLEKTVAKTRWHTRSSLASPDGWTARVIFVWVDDPARPNKRLLVLEGSSVPKTVVHAEYPVGMTGGATCEVAVQVESSGMPVNVLVGGCDPNWERAALNAVQRWTFLPRFVDGEPTSDDYVTSVTFGMY